MATRKQVDYLDILFQDCGFNLKARNLWLQEEFKRYITAPDELTVPEASRAIDLLREMKDEKWEEEARERGYEARDDYRR